jgi:hypothetical protein
MTGPRLLVLAVVSALLPATAQAQLGEAHFGIVGSFGSGDAYQGGGGVTASYQPGRLAYVGLRWIYYGGSSALVGDSTGNYDVTTRAQLFGADLGLEYPLGNVEVVGGLTLGAMRFSQGTTPVNASGATAVNDVATEFIVAPTIRAEFRTGPLMLIPEVGYYFAGSPDMRWPVGNQGWVTSLLVVIPIETRRIRY